MCATEIQSPYVLQLNHLTFKGLDNKFQNCGSIESGILKCDTVLADSNERPILSFLNIFWFTAHFHGF